MAEHEILTTRLQPQPTAAIQIVCHPSQIGPEILGVLPDVRSHLETEGVAPVGGPFARYFRESEEEIEFEAGFTLSRPAPGNDRIVAGELPGGLAAVATHVGPLSGVDAVHEAVEEWVLAHGHEPAGPVWEVYVVGPGVEQDDSRFHTDVVWPLRE